MTRQKRHVFSQEEFGARLALALELNPNAPPKYHGERVWLSEQMLKKAKKVTPETIRKWINGSSAPTHDKVPALAEVLGVDVDWLLYGEDGSRKRSKAESHDPDAAGVVNLVAGIIQMNGGDALFPTERPSGHVDLNAVIKRVTYPLHITQGEVIEGGEIEFLLPARLDDAIAIGVVQHEEGFAFDLYEIEPEAHTTDEIRRGKRVVRAKPDALRQITSFAERL